MRVTEQFPHQHHPPGEGSKDELLLGDGQSCQSRHSQGHLGAGEDVGRGADGEGDGVKGVGGRGGEDEGEGGHGQGRGEGEDAGMHDYAVWLIGWWTEVVSAGRE